MSKTPKRPTGSSFVPFVPAHQSPPEITLQAILLGCVLGLVLGAANAYMGLYAGMTISASIPASILSMAILRGLLKRGTILENNIVQTIAASGEALAAGIIFTVPAMLIAGVWTEIQLVPTFLICLTGGVLGICFMVPLRKALIVDDKRLTFPEGTACAEVLKAGEAGATGAKYILYSLVLGGVFKLLTSGWSVFKSTVEWAGRIGGFPVYMGFDFSGALLGVGYIVGFEVTTNAFLGGLIAWMIAIPLASEAPAASEELLGWYWKSWSTQIRYLGVGGMIVGGLATLISMQGSMIQGLKESLAGYKKSKDDSSAPRTERNMSGKHLGWLLIGTSVLVFVLYESLLSSPGLSLIATLVMLVLSFIFVAMGSFVCGLVGTSNSPVSGMVICSLLATAGLLVVFGITGDKAILATLGITGVVCCAIASAGDISQDLKTGHLIGATPKAQQWMELLGTVIPALVIAPTLVMLQQTYGIGTDAPGALRAPQATLFASLAKGIFGGGDLPWNMIFAGIGVGLGVLLLNAVLKAMKVKHSMPVMAVAIGLYLPLTLTLPLFIGGLISASIRNKSDSGPGTLFASGLIAGEAVVGVLLAAVIYFFKLALPITAVDSNIVSALGMFFLGGVLYVFAKMRG